MSRSNFDNSVYGWRAVVPATSANLGCAFDCGGLALRLYLSAFFTPAQSEANAHPDQSAGTPDMAKLALEYRGETPERFPIDDSNLILHALRFSAAELDAPPPSGQLTVESNIPIGVGMGSSAAAVIAGLLLGTRYAGQDVEAKAVLRWAEEIEGHIDNAAAAYHGGLVFALCNNVEQVQTLRTDFPESIRVVLVTPNIQVATHEARQVLPKAYERADVLHTLQRTALLAGTCFAGNFDLFPELFNDKLHQPYRQKLVPGMERCLRIRHDGLLGVAISGSGSSVIAFATRNEQEIGDALQEIFAEEGVQAEVRLTSADNQGAWVSREPVSMQRTLGQKARSNK